MYDDKGLIDNYYLNELLLLKWIWSLGIGFKEIAQYEAVREVVPLGFEFLAHSSHFVFKDFKSWIIIEITF